jgi:UTP--glucose-1-phosphate uridylyltransferase
MGCIGPKSVIEVRGESTFLDLTVRQIEYLNEKFNCDVPLILMNSFNTHMDTLKIIKKYNQHHIKVHTFNQKMFPRVEKENLIPLPKSIDPEKFDPADWYPPGHGDIFDSFYNSPLFKELIDQGKRYVFISNIDNLGATVDISNIVKKF